AGTQDGQKLKASPGSWSSPEALTYSYQWQRCDSTGNNCQDISGATRYLYRLAHADVGYRVTVLVTATDQDGQTGQASATPRGPVLNPPAPANTSSPQISGTPQAGQYLKVSSHGSWSSADPLTFAYQWQRCEDSSGDGCAPIATATGSTYKQTSDDIGKWLTVVATATDQERQTGQATATSVGPVSS